jgi:hypothetical protein
LNIQGSPFPGPCGRTDFEPVEVILRFWKL